MYFGSSLKYFGENNYRRIFKDFFLGYSEFILPYMLSYVWEQKNATGNLKELPTWKKSCLY